MWSPRGLSVRRYWSLDFPDAADAQTDARSEEKTVDQVRALLIDATRIRLRSDVPVGSYLSGGLDSSVIAAIAGRLAPERLRTFSVRFDNPEFDESEFQVEMATALGTDHSAVLCRASDIGANFPTVIRHAERPILRTAPAPLELLSGLVREEGFKVVLTGEGADEVFGGYDIFKEAKLRRFCARQPQSLRRPLLFRKLYPYLPKLQAQSAAYLKAFFANESRCGGRSAVLALSAASTTAGRKNLLLRRAKLTSRLRRTRRDSLDLPKNFDRWHPLSRRSISRRSTCCRATSSRRRAIVNGHGERGRGRFPFSITVGLELARQFRML